jgi:hypothetical protein
MKKLLLLLVLLAAVMGCSAVQAADPARFIGKVAVEWLDDDPFIPRMRLLEDFGFQDARGKSWVAQKGSVLDGRSLPLVFRDMFGSAFQGSYRKTSVLYDHYCHAMSEQWPEVHRMFYAASIAEGVDETEARLMYMALYAGGLRWEMKGSTCFRGCHASAAALTWKPEIQDLDLRPINAWIRQSSPDLDGIDARLNEVIRKPGPHIFVQRRD